ncbi:MAG: hypothetical protein C4318_06255 [Acidimicrobiia bacterium]
MGTASLESKSFYADNSRQRARELRRKIVYALTLAALCVVLGIAIAILVSFIASLGIQFLWNSVRG